jgi:hypothetical protein
MPQEQSACALPDTWPIYRLIRRTRLLLRSTWVITGLGLTVGLLLGTLSAMALLDTLLPVAPEVGLTPERSILPHVVLPGWGLRLGALVMIVVPAAWVFLVGVIRPLLRRLAPGQVARRIESHIPGIHNRLVSALDLSARKETAAQSQAFYRRLLQEALERIRGFRARTVVDFLSLRRAGLFAAVTVAGFALAWFFFSDRLAVAMNRIFDPFADIPPRSGVEYAVAPGDGKVLRGEDVAFKVRVEKGEPDRLWLELRSPETSERLRYDLEKHKNDPSMWTFTLGSANIAPGFTNAFRYRVYGGGTWSPQYQLTMVDRPSIVSTHTVLHYPEYMDIEPRVGPPQTLEVTGPENSQVEVVVQAEGQVSDGAIQTLEYRQPGSDVKDRPERVWFADKLPPGAAQDGTWNWDLDKHERPAHTEPAAVGLHGHWFQGATEAFPVGGNDNLFVYVYLVPGSKPDGIMLEWHDGTNWEHRAFWGEDRFPLGTAGTPGRRYVGPLPEPGRWVRLDVPADEVGLAGKGLRGMSFKVLGGQCYWGAAGVLPPVLCVKQSLAMLPSGDSQWIGRLPLHGTGLYRVELRNELGYANKTMKEAKYVAIPDNAPQIVLERPGTDLVLSAPAKVPVVLAAFDDFGLADVTLVVQRGPDGEQTTQVVKRYARPVRNDTAVTALDLPAMNLKMGDYLHYHAEARDRKGQVTRTQEYNIRLAADPNAADQQLAAFDKSEDPFREKLAKLLAEQAKVNQAVDKLNDKYAPLVEKIRAAQAAAQAAPETPADPKNPAQPKPAPEPKPLKLDPDTAKALEELQKELAKLAPQEQQNAQLGQQVANDLGSMAQQMANLKMLPQQMTNEMQALQQLFQSKALTPLQDLAGKMTNGADPKQGAPDIKEMKDTGHRLQKELEALQSRLQALADARKKTRDDVNDALKELERAMLRQNSDLTARDLEELRDYINRLREEMKRLGADQEKLNEMLKNASARDLADLEKKQEGLDKQLEKLLAAAKDLLAGDKTQEKTKRMKRQPQFPDMPYTPDNGEETVSPKEDDPDEPAADKKAADKGAQGNKEKWADKKSDDEKEEPLLMPALGGPKPKVDPRYARKMRPVEKKPKRDKGDKDDADTRRDNLEARQEQGLNNLDQAQQSLHSDQSALDQLLDQIRQAMHPGGKNGQGEPMDDDAAQQLEQLMRSQALQQAMAMAGRMRQGGRQQGNQQPGQQQPGQAQTSTGNLNGSPRTGANVDGELAKLDPASRTMILKLPPRVREELLQGMHEEGPEGYRKYIEEYFKRLTEVKSPK